MFLNERGRESRREDRINDDVLNRFISLASGVRAPDASRVSLRNKAFFGVSLGAWTQAAMRGSSAWSIGEREVMAAMVAQWNGCAFCADLHGAVAAKHMGRGTVRAVRSDYRMAQITEGLRKTLAYLEIMTLRPEKLAEDNARAVLDSGISAESLTDAIAIGAVFNLIARYLNALDLPALKADTLQRVAGTLVTSDYRF